jgi:hypothetical protein
MTIRLPNLVVDYRVRGLCARAYPGHPKGCPNFGNRIGCPPDCPLVTEVLDFSRPIFAIVNEFQLGAHVKHMQKIHPGWSQRQLECCLYWQGTARRRLRLAVVNFLLTNPDYIVLGRPEATGVDVTNTLAQVGINLEWPPKIVARQVAIAGWPRARQGAFGFSALS